MMPCACQDTNISPATDVCLHVAEYLAQIKCAFDCALNGPFDNLFLTRLSAPRVLCKGIIAVISASTVLNIKLRSNLSWLLVIVNAFYNFFKREVIFIA